MYAFQDHHQDILSGDPYNRSIRDRANESLNDLKDVLLQPQTKIKQNSAKENLAQNIQPRTLSWLEAGSRGKKYESAAENLKTLLVPELGMSPVQIDHGNRVPIVPGPMPTPEEAMVLLQNQNTYIGQIETENRYIKNEMSAVKMKLAEVVEENRRLHDELKKSIIEEIMTVGGDTKLEDIDDIFRGMNTSVSKQDSKRWQLEIERLSSLHAAKTERLESQVAHTRSEIHNYEQMVEDLKAQLRVQDCIPTHEDGLSLSSGAFISQTQRNTYLQTIDRLTSERDELIDHATSLKARVNDMMEKEESAYQQMKTALQLVEQAQLEQTDALVQKEQLSEELSNMRRRFETHVLDTQKKIEQEREFVRTENKVIIQELNMKMSEMMEKHIAVETQLEKASREKVNYRNENEDLKIQVKRFDKECSMVRDTFNAESTTTSLQRSQAINDVNKIRKELDQLKTESSQENKRMKTENVDLRRRLQIAERDLVNSKEECIHYTTNLQAMERELHMAKLSRDNVERIRVDDLKRMANRTEQREEELSQFVRDLEGKQTRTTEDMDEMIRKQNKLILKLREECRRQAIQVERLTKKYRQELGQTKKEKENFRLRLDRAIPRLKELEDQCDQHSRVHDKMTDRLKIVDEHAQNQASQILDMLAKQSGMMKDRQLLSREVEFLRLQILKNNEADMERVLGSSRKFEIDDIINKVDYDKNYPSVEKKSYDGRVDLNDLC